MLIKDYYELLDDHPMYDNKVTKQDLEWYKGITKTTLQEHYIIQALSLMNSIESEGVTGLDTGVITSITTLDELYYSLRQLIVQVNKHMQTGGGHYYVRERFKLKVMYNNLTALSNIVLEVSQKDIQLSTGVDMRTGELYVGEEKAEGPYKVLTNILTGKATPLVLKSSVTYLCTVTD